MLVSTRARCALIAVVAITSPAGAQDPEYRGVYQDLQLASRLIGEGKYEQAESLTESILKHIPDSSVAWFNLALSRSLQKKKDEEALIAVKKSLSLAADFPDAHLLAGRLLVEKDPDNAKMHAFEAAKHADQDYVVLRKAVRICLDTHDAEACAKLLEKTRKVSPEDDPDLLALEAEVALEAGKPDEAIEFYTQLAALRPLDAGPMESLAAILVVLEQDEEAMGAFLTCLEIDPTSLDARKRLISLMEKMKLPDEEIAEQRQFLAYYTEAHGVIGEQGGEVGPKAKLPATRPGEEIPVDEKTPVVEEKEPKPPGTQEAAEKGSSKSGTGRKVEAPPAPRTGRGKKPGAGRK